MTKKILLIAGIICLGFFYNNAQSDYKLAEQDSLALVAFYWATDGPNWISNQEGFGFDNLTSEWQVTYNGKFNNWFDGPVKDWFGVKVEKRPKGSTMDSIYRVTWLWPVIGRRTDGQNRLKGYIPSEVGLLTALEQFRVNGNDGFTFELIPDEIYQKTLKHFDTESAWFGGGLSDALRNCTGIRKLNIRYNNYDFMPNLDFLDENAIRNLDGTQWFYNSRFSYFYMERIVDYFYSISPNPMEFGFEARDMFDVGDDMEIVAPLGSSIEMVCNDAGLKEEFITYQWFKDGLSKFGKKDKKYAIPSVKSSDYGHYNTRITNEYVKSYDANGNYGEVFTKGINLVEEARAPIIYKSTVANNGQYIDLYFDKNMLGASGFQDLQVFVDGVHNEIISAKVRGRINREVRIFLDTPIFVGQFVTLSYDKKVIQDANGGKLGNLEDLVVENRTRNSPVIKSARTTLDGSGIIVSFDYFIDQASLSSSSFKVNGANSYEIVSKTLNPGNINPTISKTILLTLDNSISDNTEVIAVEYLDGSLHGLYGGSVLPFGPFPVENNVTADRTAVLIQFEDGSNEIENVIIQGSWKVAPIQLYNDGTNGDVTSDDNTWTNLVSLANDDYQWDVFSRSSIIVTDTIASFDSTGNLVLTLINKTENIDSQLNENYILNFNIRDKITSGDTIFGIFNRDVTFNVKVEEADQDLYLMGIGGDWNDGLLMESLGGNIYSYTVPKYTAGDFIVYNYRKGESWENQTPETREYTVKNAQNIINDDFGVFTELTEHGNSKIKVYPNPSLDGKINLEGFEKFNNVKIFDSTGKLIASIKGNLKNLIQVDLSKEPKGLYFLTASIEGSSEIISFKLLMQ